MKYVVYSRYQNTTRTEVEKKMGRIFQPGKILLNGKNEQFTSIVTDKSKIPDDGIIVFSGENEDFNNLRITMPKAIKR